MGEPRGTGSGGGRVDLSGEKIEDFEGEVVRCEKIGQLFPAGFDKEFVARREHPHSHPKLTPTL